MSMETQDSKGAERDPRDITGEIQTEMTPPEERKRINTTKEKTQPAFFLSLVDTELSSLSGDPGACDH